jgi:hypothetical protein
MGLGGNRVMSDPKTTEPDEDLLEFLGGIDEVNEDSQDADFSDYLANADVDEVAEMPRAPEKDDKRE